MNDTKHFLFDGGFTVPSQRILSVLSALLAVQLALAASLKFSEVRYQPVEASRPLLTCDFAKVSRVVIEERHADGKTTSKVEFQKDSQGWQLPEYFGFRASADSVNQLLSHLRDLKKSYPVSTTAGAADRFKVGPENFERAVELYGDHQKLGTLYLGSSPSFRTVYAKTPGTNDIYTVELSEYQINGKASEWIDRSALALKPAEVSIIDLGSFQLKKTDSQWTLVRGDKAEPLHDVVATPVVDAVAGLSINSVLGTKEDPTYNADSLVLSCRLTLKDGKTVAYAFFKPKDRSCHVLKISDKPWYLAVDDWVVNRIKGFTASSLLKSEEKETARKQGQKEKKPGTPEKMPQSK